MNDSDTPIIENKMVRIAPAEGSEGKYIATLKAKNILSELDIDVMGDALYEFVNLPSGDRTSRRTLIVDFSGVEFMSSAALGKFIRVHQTLNHKQEKLVLAGISDDIMQNFTLTKLDKMFRIVKDVDTALKGGGHAQGA